MTREEHAEDCARTAHEEEAQERLKPFSHQWWREHKRILDELKEIRRGNKAPF